VHPDFYADSTKSFNQTFLDKKFSPEFIEQLLGAIIKVNYGQSVDIAGFAGDLN